MKALPLLFLLLLAGVGRAESLELTRQAIAAPKELPGLYTLILIGQGGSSSDAERVALLDLEGDAYTFRPVTPDYRVKRLGGLSAAGALAEAERFLAGHCSYNGYRLKSLLLPTGAAAGLEMVPDYPYSLCEYGNVVTISYSVSASGQIKTYTRLLLPINNDLK